MEYMILVQDDLSNLIRIVNRYIHKGWLPQGGMASGKDEVGVWYGQAMVRSDQKEQMEKE